MGKLWTKSIVEKEITVDNLELKDIEVKDIESKNYVINNKLVTNSEDTNLLNEIKKALSECEKFYFSVAFINFSGLQLLLDSFKEAYEKGVEGKIITSTYLNFTEPKALKKLREFKNIDLNIFIATQELGFHTKAYIFENKENYKIIIGSSNITNRALKSNVEWNVMVISKRDENFIREVINEYDILWDKTDEVNEEFLATYESFLSKIHSLKKDEKLIFEEYEIIKPNYMQKRAVENLNRIRALGENKALVVAATGSGKTFMSAFDVMECNPKRLLFIVHREDILKGAYKTFKKLLKNKNKSLGFLTGNSKEMDAEYLFSTNISMNNNLQEFSEDSFDYIIIDEAHHIMGNSYKNIINYFKPKFTLGMTATPERCDGANIFEIFDDNVALEIRLREALEKGLVIPFHYFGITDISGADLSAVNIDDINKVAKILSINKRVDFIIEKMNFYGHDGNKRRCIGFCINIDHAKYMADEFNKRGINSVYLTGKNSPEERSFYIKRLEDENDDLEVIFVVDIFNEGVDIPSLNLVLMLRPTASPVIFIQQLGRGLRKHESKEFLTVLDFIGNHNKAFLIAIALSGARYYDKDSLKVSVATDFLNIPGATNIQMDKISKESILEQLENENFNSMKYLKEEYLNFKLMNGGKIPYYLVDYLKYDGAPDPIKFINKEKTYLGFLSKIEKLDEINKLLENEIFYKILRELSNMLPIKRIYEFVILKYLLRNKDINIEIAKKEISKYIEYVEDTDIIHSFRVLNRDFQDSSQISRGIDIFNISDDKISGKISFEFRRILDDKRYKEVISDVINYGIIRYLNEFGSIYYGVPFLKLYEQYQMVDIALLSNYEKIHSSFRGSGLLTNDKEYFLFIDLHKEEDIKDSINYEDKFIDRGYFQWQTPNSTGQGSDRGKNIIFNRERNTNLHIFIRKYKEIDGKVQPYIYIGKGDTVSYEGEKPITVKLKLQNIVSKELYIEFIKKV
ncbi:DEAD/DEAH box helicase [Clostridium sardiniense]|uniref:DEAD/DEAH box helicase n=1 Tax=Clostridium sardiniense TaxID=29369 RepID=UPI003D325242